MSNQQDNPATDLIARASSSWLATAATDEASEEWIHDLQIEWLTGGQFECLWRFILRLCETVDPADKEIIDKIGVDPLVNLVLWFPDQALEAIDDIADQQPTILDALSIVMGDTKALDARIDALLARHGKPRE